MCLQPTFRSNGNIRVGNAHYFFSISVQSFTKISSRPHRTKQTNKYVTEFQTEKIFQSFFFQNLLDFEFQRKKTNKRGRGEFFVEKFAFKINKLIFRHVHYQNYYGCKANFSFSSKNFQFKIKKWKKIMTKKKEKNRKNKRMEKFI